MTDIAELRRLMEASTSGEWEARVHVSQDEAVTVALVENWRVCVPTPGIPGGNYRDKDFAEPQIDARLIAAMRQALPGLLDEVEALRHDIERHVKIAADLAGEVETLRASAETVINRGVALMTDEQVGQWEGVRAWLEFQAIGRQHGD